MRHTGIKRYHRVFIKHLCTAKIHFLHRRLARTFLHNSRIPTSRHAYGNLHFQISKPQLFHSFSLPVPAFVPSTSLSRARFIPHWQWNSANPFLDADTARFNRPFANNHLYSTLCLAADRQQYLTRYRQLLALYLIKDRTKSNVIHGHRIGRWSEDRMAVSYISLVRSTIAYLDENSDGLPQEGPALRQAYHVIEALACL